MDTAHLDPLDVVGQRLAGFHVVRLFGAGTAGTVSYLALAEGDPRQVVLKLSSTYGPTTLVRFGREARVLLRVSHPSVVSFRGHGTCPHTGRAWLATEYVRGMPLARQLTGASPASLPQFMTLARPIADAVGAVHRQQVVHRGLEPANVI